MRRTFGWAPPGARKEANGIDVSSRAPEPYCAFSPFSFSEHHFIPVPGNESVRAHSVEGIWQGLKIINGHTDPSLFSGKPHKRKGHVEGHQFGSQTLDYGNARKHIYVPAYAYHAVNNSLPTVAEDLERRVSAGDVVFSDVEANGSINDLSSPYAHSELLTRILNVLIDAPLPPFNKKRFDYLPCQAEATLACRNKLPPGEQALLDDIITFAYLFAPDELKQAFALRMISLGVPDHGRLAQYAPTGKTRELYDALRR